VGDLSIEGDIEICAVKCVELETAIACIYRPPSGNHKVFFCNLQKLLDRVCKRNLNVVLCGDLNINLTAQNNRKEVLHGKRLKYLLELYNLIATNDTPTKETHMTAILIDNIFTNLRNEHFEAANKEAGISDHKNVRLSMPISRACHT